MNFVRRRRHRSIITILFRQRRKINLKASASSSIFNNVWLISAPQQRRWWTIRASGWAKAKMGALDRLQNGRIWYLRSKKTGKESTGAAFPFCVRKSYFQDWNCFGFLNVNSLFFEILCTCIRICYIYYNKVEYLQFFPLKKSNLIHTYAIGIWRKPSDEWSFYCGSVSPCARI